VSSHPRLFSPEQYICDFTAPEASIHRHEQEMWRCARLCRRLVAAIALWARRH
jgi:hypothetical protein